MEHGSERAVETQAASGERRPIRLATIVSHPIQHFCPQYASWARLDGVDLQVFFASRQGLEQYHDADFATSVRWRDLTLDFPHEFLPGAGDRPVSATLDAPAVEERLAAFRPHCVLVYGYVQRLQRRAARWARGEGVPVMMISDSELRQRRSWARRAVKALVLPPLLRKVDRFLTIGDANEAYLRRYGVADERFVRCPLSIDVDAAERALANRDERRTAVRGQHGIPADHVVLLMAGKLIARKRQRDLVALSNRVRAARDDVTVILAGSGPDEASLRRQARVHGPGGVVFAGFVQPGTLAHYYCAADAYVHCAEKDPHPLAVTEALYAGLPVVLSHRCGNHGPADEVRSGLNGYVYRCGDVEALASALAPILDSRARRESMARASRRIGLANQRLAHGDGLLQALDSLQVAAGGRPLRSAGASTEAT